MKNVFSKVIYKLLLPIVTILLRKGIAFGELSQVLKRVYIDVAIQQLLKSDGKATTSRVAIITGLTRKDVGLLRKKSEHEAVNNDASHKYNRSVRVISGWLEDEEFCSEEGYPRTLPIHGETQSFESLVNRYSGDMPVRAMMDELERVGVLEIIASHHVSLLRHAYIPEGDEDEKLTILGEDVPLLISTIDHNLVASSKNSRFQRKVCFDNLPKECLDDFQKMVNQDAQLLLEKFNEWLVQHDRDRVSVMKSKKKTESNVEERMKAGVGIYYFQQKVQETVDNKLKDTGQDQESK